MPVGLALALEETLTAVVRRTERCAEVWPLAPLRDFPLGCCKTSAMMLVATISAANARGNVPG